MLKLIKTESEHQGALSRVDYLLGNEPPEGYSQEQSDELELLIHLIDVYEEEQFPIALPSPIAAIRFKMDQLGLKQNDLVPFLGSKSRVSEVLNGKRTLTLSMIRNLHKGLGIPAEILLQKIEDLPLEEPQSSGKMDSATEQRPLI